MGGRGCKAIWRIVRTSEKILATPLEECGDQVNLESQSDESAKGESSLADELCKVISKTQSLYIKQKFAKGAQRNITDFLKA